MVIAWIGRSSRWQCQSENKRTDVYCVWPRDPRRALTLREPTCAPIGWRRMPKTIRPVRPRESMPSNGSAR